METGWAWALAGLGAIAAVRVLTKRAYASSAVVRAYVLAPVDRPFTADETQLLIARWLMGVNWITDKVGSGRTLNAEAPPVFLTLPDSYGYVRNIAETGDVAAYVLQQLVEYVGRRPLDTELWVVLTRGGGGFAGSMPQDRFAMLGDVAIESILGNPGAVIDIIFPEIPRQDKWGFVTPDAQTGALVHEVLHLVLLAPDLPDSGIMGSWDLWPNVDVEDLVLQLASTSAFFA